MNIRPAIIRQFKRPSGLMGRVAGFVMAHRESNIERNRWTLELLSLAFDDRVLEVGYGPGIAMRMASKTVTGGYLAGIDHSEVMQLQAVHRNADAVQNGQMELFHGTIDDLPYYEIPFNKIFSVNVFQFLDYPVVEFGKLRKRLVRGGLLATTYMPRHANPKKEDTERMAEAIEQALRRAGFEQMEPHYQQFGEVYAVSVVAVK